MLKEKYLASLFKTINRRINKLNIPIDTGKDKVSKDEYIIMAIDSIGIKITNIRKWMQDK